MEKVAKKNTLEDYCLGHITQNQTLWCENCIYDEKNKKCQGYSPINLSVIYIKSLESERKTA